MQAAWIGVVASGVAAVLVGAIVKARPHLLLHIPEVGWQFWLRATGHNGPMVLLYDTALYEEEEFRHWTRDGDLFVATGTKSGTTWMCYCTHSVRTGASGDVGLPFTDIMYTTPWLEMRQRPGLEWTKARELWNNTMLPDGSSLQDYWNNALFPFRIFKSHLTPKPDSGPASWHQVLPVRQFPKIKFLAMVRNGVEVATSLYGHRLRLTDAFRRDHGGFPPRPKDAESVARSLLPGGLSYDTYFGYVKGWWPYRHAPNVLLMHYSDTVRDLEGTVRKLAVFLDVKLDDAAVARAVTLCGFKNMKEHSDWFDYKMPFFADQHKVIGGLVNKGKSDGGFKMSPQLQAEWDAAVLAEFSDPTLRRWAAEGGSW